jgi:hypothetical protein
MLKNVAPLMTSKAAFVKTSFRLSAIAAFVVSTAPVLAQEQKAQNDASALSKVKPARLIEFTGDREFLKESARLRVWRGEVGYRLEVDAAGTPVDCELAERFRMNYVNDKLCEVLMKHHTFEPAENASGTPVEGSYEGRLNFLEIRQKD